MLFASRKTPPFSCTYIRPCVSEMALDPHKFPSEISPKQDNYLFLSQKYIICLELKIVQFTLINRLSQQKWNASFSDCVLLVLGKTPVVLDYLHYFQPVIDFLYLGTICSMWATSCLVSIEMVHLRLVFMLHFRHTDTEVRDSLPWNIGTGFDNDLCSQWTNGRILRGIQITVLMVMGTMSCFASWLSRLNWAPMDAASEMDLRSTQAVACYMEIMFLFTCSW